MGCPDRSHDEVSMTPTHFDRKKKASRFQARERGRSPEPRIGLMMCSPSTTGISEATGIREKEAAVFAAEKADLTANINALAGAMATFEKGMGGGFLQT